jgi:iron complex outermembrane receptor protein
MLKSKTRAKLLCATGIAALQLFSATAHAQTARAPASEDGFDAPTDIIVTAQKRSERMLEVPVAITALDSTSLGERNQVQIQDYVAKVPGLAFSEQGGGRVNLAIRGITTGTTNNATVGVTIDDVPIGGSTGFSYGDTLVPELDPSILQRVEVLRGPQGTIYGASSLGGLLKYVTADPSLTDTSGRIESSINTVEQGDVGFGIRGMASMPIVADKLGIQVSMFTRRDPGYVDDPAQAIADVNQVDNFGGRVALLWKPAEAVSLRLAAIYQESNGDGTAEVDGDAAGRPTIGLAHNRLVGSGSYHRTFALYSANLDVDLQWATLSSVTGYSRSFYESFDDVDDTLNSYAVAGSGDPTAAALTDFSVPTEKFSQEIRLASASGGKLEWLIGGFYTKENSDPFYNLLAVDRATGSTIIPVLPDRYPNNFQEYSAFGTLTYHFSDRFDVQVGGRYSKNKQFYHETITGPFFDPDIYDVTARSKDSSFTYLFSPRFRITPDVMVYARVASGYRPGGPNPGAAFGFPATYTADTTVSYEVGAKASLLDRRLTVEASVYDIEWDDIQLRRTDPVTRFAYFENSGKARSRGAELALTVNPIRGMTLDGNVSYTDATLREDVTFGAGGPVLIPAGEMLPFSSKWSGSVGIEQRFDLGGTEAFIGGDFNFTSNRLGDPPTLPTGVRLRLPSYETFNLRAGLEAASGLLITVYVKNLTDKRGVINAEERGTGSTIVLSRPRTIGLSLAQKF